MLEAARSLGHIVEELSETVTGVECGPRAAYVYNPLQYAEHGWREYVRRFAAPRAGGERRIVLVGMNPGPWGMAQTGVPFGAVARVRDWLGIEVPIGRPAREHPKKPVLGFQCQRQEVSGDRLWGWAERRFEAPERFFCRFFVWNYCPLLFLEESGRNLTPDKLPADARRAVLEPCDRALRAAVQALDAGLIIGVGTFAERSARRALEGLGIRIGRILHPSPASPAANRGWARQAEAQLRELGVGVLN